MFSDVELYTPTDDVHDIRVSVTEQNDGNLLATAMVQSNLAEQGRYTLKLFAGESDVEESYSYPMEVSVGSPGYLSARVDDYNTPRAPYIMEEVTGYDFAASGTGSVEFVYFRPQNEYSAQVFAMFTFIYSNSVEYLAILSPSNMESTKWTKVPVADLIRNDSSSPAIPAGFTDGDGWSMRSYASTFTNTAWGELIRSELRSAIKIEENPPVGDVLSMSGGTVSRGMKTLDDYNLPPLARIMLENGGLDF